MNRSQRVGIVGIGIMGTAYANSLLRAGFSVSGFDVDEARKEALRELGGEPLGSVADVARNSDVMLVALPSVSALESVVEELATAGESLIVVEMSTFPLDAKELARDQLVAHGIGVLDAPVSGTGLQAASADIVVYASGEEGALAAARPVFDVIAKATFELGAFGNGSKMKYLANLLVSVHNLATAEAFALGMKGGLDPQLILDVVSAGVGSSRIFEIRGPMMVADQYDPAAKLKMFIKDISIIGDYARSLDVPTPLLDTSLGWYEEAINQGLGELDPAALCRLIESKAGVER